MSLALCVKSIFLDCNIKLSDMINANYNMGERILQRRKNKILVAISLSVFIIGFVFGTYRSSAVQKGFPIPMFAKQIGGDEQEGWEQYEWWLASEENGLPSHYRVVITLWGWEEIEEEQMGARKVFEKDGQKVFVISVTDELVISTKV